jgi:hypothetical protein
MGEVGQDLKEHAVYAATTVAHSASYLKSVLG